MAAAGFPLDQFYMPFPILREDQDTATGNLLVPFGDLGLAQRVDRHIS